MCSTYTFFNHANLISTLVFPLINYSFREIYRAYQQLTVGIILNTFIFVVLYVPGTVCLDMAHILIRCKIYGWYQLE